MSIIDIPLSNNLLEQHQEASDTGAEYIIDIGNCDRSNISDEIKGELLTLEI